MIAMLLWASVVVAEEPSAPTPPAVHSRVEALVLKASRVWAGPGRVFEPGAVVVLDGEVVAVGPQPGLPDGSRVIDCGEGSVITAGLVDAACQLGVHDVTGFSEQSSEVIPQFSVRDSVDLYSEALEQLAREGVTTICITPEAASVISSRSAVVKTGGAGLSRFVDAPEFVKGTLGPETSRRGSFNRTPSSRGQITFNVRRPTTRMGSTWEFRYAFHNAKRFAAGKELPVDADPEAMAVLTRVLGQELGFRFQARKRHDIDSAYRLCDEAGVSKITLEYAQEAFLCLDRIAERGSSVIYGPIFVNAIGTTGFDDTTEPCLSAPAKLAERGIPFCLTACDLVEEDGLVRQAGIAYRNGLDAETSLSAVTAAPARMLGLEARVGSLERGHDADLVVWSGDPLQITSRTRLVLIDGAAAYDPEGLLAQSAASE